MAEKNFRWIDGGQLMERWGMNAFELRQLIYNGDLDAYNATTGSKFIHYTGPDSWMALPDTVIQTLRDAPLYPLEMQKKALSAVIFFKPVDVEKFEKEHPELLQKRINQKREKHEVSFTSDNHKKNDKEIGKEETSISENVFKKEDKFWTIVYQGNKLRPIKHLKGMEYIQYLLCHQEREFHIFEFENLSKGKIQDTPSLSATQIKEEGLGQDGFGTMDEKSINKTGKDIKKRLQELKDKYNEAVEFENYELAEQMDKEKDKLLKYLSGFFDKKGRPREASKDVDSARSRISKAFDRAFKEIEKENDNLHKHLRNSIGPIGEYINYSPDRTIKWTTD